ncbi:tyrosine-type recombinase/integrase [Lutibacter sp.]|uniref:tyrosine-type recombinase/integrase n=1 Tax=Lutibacter sp. TaxID=1925666 RepID=UPI0035618C83
MEIQKQKISLTVSLFKFKMIYSKVKMFKGKGIKTNEVDIDKDWYVYYSYRNPYTDKMERFIVKAGINTITSVTKRNIAIKYLQQGVTCWLQDGYNPFTENTKLEDINKTTYTIAEALQLAFTEKCKVWAETTKHSHRSLFNVFIGWINENNLTKKNIEDLTKRHISLFLNNLTTKNEITSITRNNYRRLVVSLIQQLVNDDILKQNFTNSIPKHKEVPKKNKPFTKLQLIDIKKYLLANDPYLFKYIQFVMYAFLRPIEVTRIKVENIDLIRGIIEVKTKTEDSSTVLIIDKLRSVIETLDIDYKKNNYHIFTNEFKPALWNTSREKSKTDFFIRRFKKLKNKLNLNNDYGIYSFRHTFALDLYNSFLKQGLTQLESKHKLMTITRHKSMSGLENYLRDIGAELPKDYSSDFTIDF